VSQPPGPLELLEARLPAAKQAYARLRAALEESSPLDARTRELINIGILVAGRAAPGVAVHAGRALEAGASVDEVYAAIAQALPIVGISPVLAALGPAHEGMSR